jgi:uncharacterized protein YciI
MKNFIIDLEYIVPLDAVEPHLEAHLQFVDEGYEKGYFLASGPKVPRSGGVIFAVAESKEALVSFSNKDPFISEKLAQLTITEFIARRTAPQMANAFAG